MSPTGKKVENSLLQSKQYFAEQYIDNSSTAIIAINIEETVIIYNQAAEDMIGIPADEVLGKPFACLLDKKSGTQDSILLSTLRTGNPYTHVEAVIDTPLGVMNVMAYTTLIYDEHGEIIGSILSIRDITSQKQLEDKVINAEKFAVIGELAAGIAHEVRNPLTSVKGFLQLLAQKLDNDAQVQQYKQYIGIMLDEINRINRIITEFLMLARPAVPVKRKANIHEVLDEILLLSEGEFHIRNIRLTKNYASDCPELTIDVEQIKQVFLNLVSNAVAAMSEKGRLDVTTEYNKSENVVRLFFTDNGQGIEPAKLDMIFDPFYTTKEEGTGLGLTVSYRIIENHMGKIDVISEPGQGSTFIITLPAV